MLFIKKAKQNFQKSCSIQQANPSRAGAGLLETKAGEITKQAVRPFCQT